MSLIKITEDDVETFTIVTNPKKTYSSSSIDGASGEISLFARRSSIEKEARPLLQTGVQVFNEESIESLRLKIVEKAKNSTNVSSEVNYYIAGVNSELSSSKKHKKLNIFRFEPSFEFTDDTLKKRAVQELYPYYRNQYPDAHWAYTNYHCINFFTASGVPGDSVLLYPNSSSVPSLSSVSGSYSLADAFTFEFYINPRYTTDGPTNDFKAGTIFHLSSSYAISLVSGSSKDSKGFVDKYKILLQLSHSADISPSLAAAGSYPRDLIFETNDNVLKRNNWHHVAIRWGTSKINQGSGSFFVDGVEAGTFVVPSASIAPAPYSLPKANPDVLCIGNFYEGINTGSAAQSIFFNNEPSVRDGLVNLAPGFNQHQPSQFSFSHPLNAEVHDLRIYNSFRLISNIDYDRTNGPSSLSGLVFYLGPFFTRESPTRTVLNQQGGVLQTPFFGIDGTTDDPFNVAMSFGVGGHYMNLENFLRDLATNNYPRQYQLTGSQILDTISPVAANESLYLTGSVKKRNVTILPCDNGLFIPNFDLLKSGTILNVPSNGSVMDKFVNDLGHLDLTLISLKNLVSTSSLRPGLVPQSGSMFDAIAGATPEDPGVDPGEVLTIYQRTRDNSSNEVSFFEISNIFFGNRIKPESFKITDSKISGSGDKVSIALRDNGYGNLYRADSLTEHAKWNSVGNIFYNEGIAVVKSPNIPFFGKEQFSMEFEGEQTIHVLMLSAEASAGLVNSSSHPNFIPVSASLNVNESDTSFVYITNIDWLDDNLNVVMKTNLAQPIKKRNSDKLLVKAKMDW
jgi:hypothetical protein